MTDAQCCISGVCDFHNALNTARLDRTAESIARAFHETYERYAPQFGYRTRKESAVPWDDVPAQNRLLMTATVETLLAAGVVSMRHSALTDAWQAVDRAVRPLGTECGQSRWNAGYTQARDEAQNAILELRDRG